MAVKGKVYICFLWKENKMAVLNAVLQIGWRCVQNSAYRNRYK